VRFPHLRAQALSRGHVDRERRLALHVPRTPTLRARARVAERDGSLALGLTLPRDAGRMVRRMVRTGRLRLNDAKRR